MEIINYSNAIELNNRILELEDTIKKAKTELLTLKLEQHKYPGIIPDNVEDRLKEVIAKSFDNNFKRTYKPKGEGVFGIEFIEKVYYDGYELKDKCDKISSNVFGKPGALKATIIQSSYNSCGQFNKFVILYTAQYLNKESQWHKGIKKYQQ